MHTHTMPSHNHTVDVQVNAHSHGMSHTHPVTTTKNIYIGDKASNVSVYVDGNLVASGLSGDDYTIDITNKFANQEWHEIKFTSATMGRIQASLFIQYFVLF